jgi:hypothetical protein
MFVLNVCGHGVFVTMELVVITQLVITAVLA